MCVLANLFLDSNSSEEHQYWSRTLPSAAALSFDLLLIPFSPSSFNRLLASLPFFTVLLSHRRLRQPPPPLPKRLSRFVYQRVDLHFVCVLSAVVFFFSLHSALCLPQSSGGVSWDDVTSLTHNDTQSAKPYERFTSNMYNLYMERSCKLNENRHTDTIAL